MKQISPKGIFLACFLFLLSLAIPCAADTHYVSTSGSNESPYTTPEAAARSIQNAMDAASSGDRVLVSPGTYTENICFKGKNLEVGSLFLTEGDTNYIASTVIDGGAAGSVVTFTNSETASARLCGFTITNGLAGTSLHHGGGIRCKFSSPTLDHLIVSGNRCEDSSGEGGGIFLEFSYSSVRHVVSRGNHADHTAGGIRVSYGLPTFVNVVVEDNTCNLGGGGMLIYHSSCSLRNVLIANNTAFAGEGGGGVFLDGSSPVFENVTFVGNSAVSGVGGGLNVSYYSSPTLLNCIAWDNTPEQISFNTAWSGMSITVNYSDLQGGQTGIVTRGKGPVYWGGGNLQVDPLFAGSGSYRLQSGSPCINTGTNKSWMATEVDLSGNSRIFEDTVDMGPYEGAVPSGGVIVSTPQAPQGSSFGLINAILAFVTGGSVCSDDSPVEYRFAWGDGTMSGWSSATNTHAWQSVGAFSVRAQARSATQTDRVSSWSAESSLSITSTPPVAATRYVSPTGGNVSPYTSWATAAHKIQDAMDVALSGDRVLVAPATYTENICFKGKNLEVGSLYLTEGDTNYIASTVINGGAAGSVVTFTNSETASARLCGFTITNGLAGTSLHHGGGIRCSGANPTLDHLIVSGNSCVGPSGEGGGIYLEHSYSSVRHVVVRGNSAGHTAGGIRVSYGLPTFANIVIEGNTCELAGGGMLIYHSSCSLRNVLIANNIADSGEGGGGVFLDGSSPVFENVTFVGNSSISGVGGGLNVSYCSSPRLLNCIAWGNSPEQISFNTAWYGMSITIDSSDIQDGLAGVITRGKGPVYWGGGNLQVDPLFAGSGSYRLQSGSPCINTGTNQSWMATEVDLSGNSRIVNSVVDMGAYEFLPAPEPQPGSVTCTIMPADVRAIGAQWRMTSGSATNWNDSGETLRNIAAGEYVVTFTSLSSWTEPDDRLVIVSEGSNTCLEVAYTPAIVDTEPPVILHIVPPDGHVSNGNQVPMTITASDNIDVVTVTVNGAPATESGGDVFHYTADGISGSFNTFVVVAMDPMGNAVTQTVHYGQGGKITLTAMWDGYWRVRNPYTNSYDFTWQVVDSSENGSGTVVSNSDAFFSTTLGPKTVVLLIDATEVDRKKSSHASPAAGGPLDVTLDSDSDGMANFDEELAGSDPEDSENCFYVLMRTAGDIGPLSGRVLRLDGESAGNLEYAWASSTDRLYTVESATNLFQWTAMPGVTDLAGTGNTMSYTNQSMVEAQFFLRVTARKRP